MPMTHDIEVPIRRNGSRRLAGATLLLAGGLLVAACSSGSTSSPSTTASSGGSTATTSAAATTGSGGLSALVTKVSKGSTSTFSATYQVTEATTGKTETVTFAQSPPKSSIVTSSGSFFLDGTSVTECQGSGSSATCTTLPSSMTGALTSLSNLFSPAVLTNTLKGMQAAVAANHAGYVVSTSTGTYGGQASQCITVKGTAEPTPVTYCAATSNGVLTYLDANGNTLTLQSFSSSPPASAFSPPAGATVQTLPAGA